MRLNLFNKPKAQESGDGGETVVIESVYVSVSEAAVMMEVYENTIRSWFDSGWLDGYKTPSGHRKISRASVERRQQEKKKGESK